MHVFTAPPHSSPSEASRISRQDRLFATAKDLVQQGLHPLEVESRLYESLSADPSKVSDVLKACRIRLFQATMGLQSPLSRDEASNLATAAWRALRGPPDLDFERQVLLANLLNNLVQAAHDAAEELRRDGIAVGAENLKSALMFAIVNARPRSSIVPWHLPDSIVEKTIYVAINYFFSEVQCSIANPTLKPITPPTSP